MYSKNQTVSLSTSGKYKVEFPNWQLLSFVTQILLTLILNTNIILYLFNSFVITKLLLTIL